MNRLRIISLVLVGLAILLLGGWLRAIYASEWLQLDPTQNPPALRPWPVEADCYSQLARVQRILQGKGLIQNYFEVENWPEGLMPSTTSPFDYVILLLYAPLTLFTKFPLDWAGALVSPALWLGLVLFWLCFRSHKFNQAGRIVFLIGSALLPAFIWATAFGRPRHQSLILALMAIGLTAEYERWHLGTKPRRVWHIFAGLVWALAWWTSLFEPVLVVSVLIIFNLVTRRREKIEFLVSFSAGLLVAYLVEGVHIFLPPPEYHIALVNWLRSIAEVQSIGFTNFIKQLTLLSFVFLVPFFAWRLLRHKGDTRTDLLLVLLTVLLIGLAFVQKRWIYYANLTELFLLVRYVQIAPARWTRILIMAFFLFSAGYDNTQQIQGRLNLPDSQPSPELARLAQSIDQPGGIMAPWWISPGLLYFSGQPIVSGSSHCGISGILASAQFYATTSWTDAELILQQRKVRWIVVYDDPRYLYPTLNTARAVLGLPNYTDHDKLVADASVAQMLVTTRYLPASIQLYSVMPHLKLYQYVPETAR